MNNSILSKEDIDRNILASDILIVMGSVFFDQEDNIRKFIANPNDEERSMVVFVNMERNEWRTGKPLMEGKASDLLEKVFSLQPGEVGDTIYNVALTVHNQPKASSYLFDPTEKIKVAMDVGPIEDNGILAPLYCMGITQSLAYKYMKQGTFTGIRDGKEHHMLLFPNSNGGYYGLNGKGWRTVGEDGILLLGPTSDAQRLCVFDSPFDFLALQQKRHILGTDVFFSTDRYLIINGKKNLDDALGHISTHPEYYRVCCFFPTTDDGKKLLAKFHDICQGTDIDSSRLYADCKSIADSLDHDCQIRRDNGLVTMSGIIRAARKKEAEAKAAAEKQAQAAKQQTQTPAANKQQPKVQNVPQTATVRDTPKPKSETTTTTQKVATDDVKPKRGFGR